jgi:hypothetical protein
MLLPFCPHFKTIPHPQLKVNFQYMKPKYGNQKHKKCFSSNRVKHTFTLSFVSGHACVKDIYTHPLLVDISWELSCRQNIGGYMIYLCPILGFPTVLFCWNFKAIARMHGTFYRDTTPIHVALMAKAHKVCNQPSTKYCKR